MAQNTKCVMDAVPMSPSSNASSKRSPEHHFERLATASWADHGIAGFSERRGQAQSAKLKAMVAGRDIAFAELKALR